MGNVDWWDMKIPDKYAFWRWPSKIRELSSELEALKAEHAKVMAGQKNLLEWVKVTHRLTSPAEGIRAMLQSGKRLVALTLMLFIGQCLMAQPAPPIVRNPMTTNGHFGPTPTEGQVPIWNAAANKWSNNIISGSGIGFGALVWTNDNGVIYPIVDPSRIQFLTNRIYGRLIRADGTNTVFGSNALPVDVLGEDSVAIGNNALGFVGAGQGSLNNVAIGHGSSISNSGSFNVSIGFESMQFNQFRSDNVGIGYQSLRTFHTGNQNTAVGGGTMDLLSTAFDGAAFGWGAMDKMEGIGNSAFGSQALLNASGGGNYNLAVGYEALENSARLEGNVAIGRRALTGIADLTNVVVVGFQATALSGGLTNAVAIGALTRITADNQMMLGTNIVRYVFRNVDYEFPTTNGVAGQFLVAVNSAGVLAWSNAPAGSGGVAFSDLVWTNDNGTLKPVAFPTNILLRVNVPDDGTGTNFYFDSRVYRTNAATKLFAIYNGGSNAVTVGPYGGLFMGRNNETPFPGAVLYGIFDTALGETNQQEIFTMSQNSAVGYNGAASVLVDTNYGALLLFANKEGGTKFTRFGIQAGAGIDPENFNTFTMQALVDGATYFQVDPNFSLLTPTNYLFSSSVRITNTHTLMSLQNSNFPVLEVDGVGDLRLIKKIPYTWPSAQGLSQTVLTNDGSGNLGWGAVSVAGSPGLTTNVNQFLGVPLSIISGAQLTNIDVWGTGTSGLIVRGSNDAAAAENVMIQNQGVSPGGVSTIRFSSSLASGGSLTKIRSTMVDTNGGLSASLAFQTRLAGSLADRVTINTNGYVGINLPVSAAQVPLQIAGPPAFGDAAVRLEQTNGRGYSEFTVTNSVIATNRFVFSVGSNTVSPGQVFKFHSTSIAGGINNIVVTNDSDNSGGGGLTTNENQFLGVPLSIKAGALVSNISVYANDYTGTNRAITVQGYHNSISSTDALVRVIGAQPIISGNDNVLLEVGPFDAPVGFRVYNNNRVETHSRLTTGYGERIDLVNSDGSPGIEMRPGGSGLQNCFVGFSAAGLFASSSTGHHNAFFGTSAGNTVTAGEYNTFLGQAAGETAGSNVSHNTFVGQASGFWSKTNLNTFVGSGSGTLSTNGSRNVLVGASAGVVANGHFNTFVGTGAGFSAITNSGGVYIGYQAGTWETAANTLFIDNTQRINESDARTNALIHGIFDPTRLTQRLSFNAGLVSQPGSLGYLNFGESTLPGYVGFGAAATKTAPNLAGVTFVSDGNTIHLGYVTQFFINASGSTKISVGRGGTDGFVGIGMGVETPGALLSAGSGSRFQADGDGDIRTHQSIVITNLPGSFDSFLRLAQTNGRGYTDFTTTNSVIATNRYVWSFGSNTVAAGQVAKVHSTVIAGGINSVVITNDTDNAVAGPAAITNLISLTLSNDTIKPLVVGVGDAAAATNTTGEIRGLEAGANITLTPNGSNYVIAATASGSAIFFTNQLWVELTGNDATGARNDPSKPFRTMTNAMAATIPGDVINIGVGRFTNFAGPLTISNSVTIRGVDWNNTVLLGTNALGTTGVNFKPLDNSTIEHLRLEIAENLGVPSPLFGRHSSFDTGGFTNVTVRNVRMVGFSDNIVIVTGASDPAIAQFIDCEFDTGGDMVVLHGSADSHLKFQRCHFFGHDPIASTTCAYRASTGNATFEFCNFASTNNGPVVKGLEIISTAGARILSSTFNLGCTSGNVSNVMSTSSRPVVLVNCLVTTNTMSGFVLQEPSFVSAVAQGAFITLTTNSSALVTVAANLSGVTNTPIIAAGNLHVTNQLLRVNEDFNGGTVFTNLDFTGSMIKTMTNAITGSRTNNLTNAIGGASMIVYVVGETATATDRNYTFTAASANIRWMNSPTNANSIDVLINSNQVYVFRFDVVTNATGPATNIIASWQTDSQRPIFNRAVPVSAGAGTSNAWVEGRVFVDATTATTNHTGTANFTNLFTFTVPANTLTNLNDEVEFYLSGHFRYGTATTNGFRGIYGTSTLFDTGFLTYSNCPWKAQIKITRTGNSAQWVECEVIAQAPAAGLHGNGTLLAYRTNMPLAQVNGVTNIFAFQGESRLAAVITNNYRSVRWNPGPR